MSPSSWLVEALGRQPLEEALAEASRRRVHSTLSLDRPFQNDEDLRFAGGVLDLALFEQLMDPAASVESLRAVAANAFRMLRSLTAPEESLKRQEWLLKLGCQAVLGDRAADAKRLLIGESWEHFTAYGEWGDRVKVSIYSAWVRIIRKNGWEDLEAVQRDIADLRARQAEFEKQYLESRDGITAQAAAWELVSLYHLAKAVDLLAQFTTQGMLEGTFDIEPKLQAQFDRARDAAVQSNIPGFEGLTLLLYRTAVTLVRNSIWGLSRGAGTKVRRFVEAMVSRQRDTPIFELLPPQRQTLKEQGLITSGRRSVVVSLPTSSGKTLIAQFRILQALNQFDDVEGWVAYLAPTRALVNQLTVRLRRDFAPLGISVERVSPALEVDGMEAGLLMDSGASKFRVLVTTPEKLDLLLRNAWEEKVGRPLTLIVVDEAHNLSDEGRGLRLELLLATVNRECQEAHFLLLTPFISNGDAIARWLDPQDALGIELAVDWQPNDRAIVLSKPVQEATRRDFHLQFETLHTSKETVTLPETIRMPQNRPLEFTWSEVKGHAGHIAAATAQVLRSRGSVVVLARAPKDCWAIAESIAAKSDPTESLPAVVGEICDFFRDAFGQHFRLPDLIQRRIAVHHGGLSEDARILVEWLFEKGHIDVMVATTTLAQGVNFPLSGVVLASHKAGGRRDGENMTPADFWNIAGRAGRVDQGDMGIIALACINDGRAEELRAYVQENVGALNSTLIQMVQQATTPEGGMLPLHSLSVRPAWSSFLQYLAHTYRQMNNHERFASDVEEVLRGTLGFGALRQSHPHLAAQLILGVRDYAERIQGKQLSFVDNTGFSWESVGNTLVRLREERINDRSWDPDHLFQAPTGSLQRMMGVLLQVPELRENLSEAIGGRAPDGNLLARIVSDWVQGTSLEVMASRYYSGGRTELTDDEATLAMTKCCKSLFGRLAQTAAWGLSALQSLTLTGTSLDRLTQEAQQKLRNLPSRVYYGVNSDEAIALRLLGVPREAAQPLADQIGREPLTRPLSRIREDLREAGVTPWIEALGTLGQAYHRAWAIMEGNE